MRWASFPDDALTSEGLYAHLEQDDSGGVVIALPAGDAGVTPSEATAVDGVPSEA